MKIWHRILFFLLSNVSGLVWSAEITEIRPKTECEAFFADFFEELPLEMRHEISKHFLPSHLIELGERTKDRYGASKQYLLKHIYKVLSAYPELTQQVVRDILYTNAWLVQEFYNHSDYLTLFRKTIESMPNNKDSEGKSDNGQGREAILSSLKDQHFIDETSTALNRSCDLVRLLQSNTPKATLEQIQSCIDAGALVNVLVPWGVHHNALSYIMEDCSRRSHDPAAWLSIIKRLVLRGAGVNFRGTYNVPLMCCMRGAEISSNTGDACLEAAQFMLDHGAKVDAKDNTNQTVLMRAVMSKDTHMARLLMRYGADVNAQDDAGDTPLSYAAYFGADEYLTKELIAHGACVDIANNEGEIPLFRCEPEFRSGFLEQMKQLLSANKDTVHWRNKQGETPLMKYYRQPELVRLLLEHGADQDAQDNYGRTISMRIAEECAAFPPCSMLSLLLKYKVNLSIRNKDGKTAYEIAKKAYDDRWLESSVPLYFLPETDREGGDWVEIGDKIYPA